MRLLVDVVFVVGLVLGWPLWRRKPRADWAGRWGKVRALGDAPDGGRVVVHAVSVGEVNASAPMLRRLLMDERFGGAEVVLAATTDTGHARAEAVAGGLGAGEGGERGVVVTRYPLDASWAVRRWFDRVRPTVLVLVELELWPNMLLEARRRGVPVCVVNGRLSERSFRGYRRFRWAVGWMFAAVRVTAVQDEAYAERFRAMGAEDVRVTGSMKWDAALDGVSGAAGDGVERDAADLVGALGIDRSRAVVVLGSAGPGEARLVREALSEAGVEATLVVAPRKPEWFDGSAEELGVCVRRSRGETLDGAVGCVLLDTIGELRAAYALCDVAVVGRSFCGLYGSDVMEPAALGRAVLIGDEHGDFVESVRLLREAGGLLVVTRKTLGRELGRLLRDEAARCAMGAKARRCVEEHAGAASRHVGVIAEAAGC